MANLTITATQVQPDTTGVLVSGIAGETITAGQVCYEDPDDNYEFKLADCDNASSTVRTVRGIAVNGATAGQPVRLQVSGDLTLGAGAAPVLGTIYCLSNTAGAIMPAADLSTGEYTHILGVGYTGNKLRMKIHNAAIATT
jgi:hypothetical protein